MAVPKKKTSTSRRNMRRAHHALNVQSVTENQTTGEYSLPHHVSKDGYYKGRQVFVVRNREAAAE
jgi:large subunit ribosomal protein L32